MPGKRQFEAQIAALEELRHQPEQVRVEALRKALTGKNNFLVAKAADLVRECNLAQLLPDLLMALDRFFEDPGKTDPQCWAKNAISRALVALDCQDAGIYLRGVRHIQMEPVWGGQSDTAGTLRATCALALVQCRSINDNDLLAHLIDLACDKDKLVRTETMRAIEQVGSASSGLLLRLRAVLAGEEPEVLGACCSGILRLEGVTAIPWMKRFLSVADENAAEAALAIAETRSPEAFAALRECLEEKQGNNRDPWWRSVLLSAIALTRQDAAQEFLLELVGAESLDAEAAIEAILRSMPSDDVVTRLEKLVAGNPRLARAFEKHKGTR